MHLRHLMYIGVNFIFLKVHNIIKKKKMKICNFSFLISKKYTSSVLAKSEKLHNVTFFIKLYILQKNKISLEIHAMPEIHYRSKLLSFLYSFGLTH